VAAWTKYLENNLNRDIPQNAGGPPGRYTVWLTFIVDKNGVISEVKAQNNPGYGTAEEAKRLAEMVKTELEKDKLMSSMGRM
jgi:protein TonB